MLLHRAHDPAPTARRFLARADHTNEWVNPLTHHLSELRHQFHCSWTDASLSRGMLGGWISSVTRWDSSKGREHLYAALNGAGQKLWGLQPFCCQRWQQQPLHTTLQGSTVGLLGLSSPASHPSSPLPVFSSAKTHLRRRSRGLVHFSKWSFSVFQGTSLWKRLCLHTAAAYAQNVYAEEEHFSAASSGWEFAFFLCRSPWIYSISSCSLCN